MTQTIDTRLRHTGARAELHRMRIVSTITWDDDGIPVLELSRGNRTVGVGQKDAYLYETDSHEGVSRCGKLASALGLDYWSQADRHAVIDAIQQSLGRLLMAAPGPDDGLAQRRAMRAEGVRRVTLSQGGETIREIES